jgi:glycerol kinase
MVHAGSYLNKGMRMNVYPTSIHQKEGLQLRDLFAAKAMQGILSNAHLAKENPMDRNLIAGTAYEVADAMMIARG